MKQSLFFFLHCYEKMAGEGKFHVKKRYFRLLYPLLNPQKTQSFQHMHFARGSLVYNLTKFENSRVNNCVDIVRNKKSLVKFRELSLSQILLSKDKLYLFGIISGSTLIALQQFSFECCEKLAGKRPMFS